MISSMDLFFNRDCAEGIGPAVELPNVFFAASPDVAGVVPEAGAVVVVVEPAGCAEVAAVVAAGFVPPNIEPDGPLVVVGALAGAELLGAALLAGGLNPPNRLGPEEAVVVAGPDVGADAGAVVEAEVVPPNEGKLKPPPVLGAAGLLVAPGLLNRLLVGAAVEAGVELPPPRVKGADSEGCEVDGWPEVGAGFEPSSDGVLAGVEEGAAPRLNKEDDVFGAACEVGAPSCGAPPPNRLGVAGAGCAGVFLLASSPDGAALPKLKPPPLLPVVPALGVALPNRPPVEADVVAGFGAAAPPPNKLLPDPDPDPAPDPPKPLKTLFPGGGPAGVVEGRNEVLFGAGVAVGVDDPVKMH